jgi:hypothetical protein
MKDTPRSLKDQEKCRERRAMLTQKHVSCLASYVGLLRKKYPQSEFPDFDPLDGGTEAEILFLFEKPGRRTSSGEGGSGFISRNNDDGTAAATFEMMKQAKLSRKATAIWNLVPGWNGTRKITSQEFRAGIDEVGNLLELFDRVTTVVLVGRRAQRAESQMPKHLKIIKSAHPSPIVRATRPNVWKQISSAWAKAR